MRISYKSDQGLLDVANNVFLTFFNLTKMLWYMTTIIKIIEIYVRFKVNGEKLEPYDYSGKIIVLLSVIFRSG